MFVGMNEFNPHIGIVFETDIIGDLEEKVVTTSGLESERHFSQTDFEVIFFRKPIPDPTLFEHKSTESRTVKPAIGIQQKTFVRGCRTKHKHIVTQIASPVAMS